jgi:hypothetical protein
MLLVIGVLISGEPAGAVDCACVNVNADSYSDSGSCVVIESKPRYCTLDWRHGATSEPTDDNESVKAEERTQALIKFATSGALPESNMFADKGLWSRLAKLAAENKIKELYKFAATYLELTRPIEYERDLVLASMAVLIGSSRPAPNRSVPSVVLRYLSDFGQQILNRVIGKAPFDPKPKNTDLGLIADFSAVGCFEIRKFPADVSLDATSPDAFDLRVGVRTKYAEDSSCLKRR